MSRRFLTNAALSLVVISSVVNAAEEEQTIETTGTLSVTQVVRMGTTRFRHGTAIADLWFPTNERVVSSGGLKFCSWNAVTGELEQEIQNEKYSWSFFDGERRLLTAEPSINGLPTQTFHLTDLLTGEQTAHWKHPSSTRSAAVSRNGQFAAMGLTGPEHTVSLVALQTGEVIDRIKRRIPRGTVGSYPWVSLSPDDRIVGVATNKNRVEFYELNAQGKVQSPLVTIDDQSFLRIIFSPRRDQVLLLGPERSTIWNVRTGKLLQQWDEPDINFPSDAAFDTKGKIVAELADGIVRVRDVQTGKQLRSFPVKTYPRLEQIALSPDGAVLAAGGYQERIRFFDFASGKEIRFDADQETYGPVRSVAISDDGEWIGSAELKGEVSLWDRKTGWKRLLLKDDDIRQKNRWDTKASSDFVTFLPGTDRLLAGSSIYHNSLNVWDAATAQRVQRFVGHAMPIIGVAVNRDGNVLASTSRDDTLRIWDREGKQQQLIRDAGGGLLSLSPDGSLVAVSLLRENPRTGRNGIPDPQTYRAAVELWDTATGKLVRSMSDVTGDPYRSLSVSFSHDGPFLAGISTDGLHVWDVATGARTRLIRLPLPVASNSSWHALRYGCAFSPVDNIIAVPTAEGSIVFLDAEAPTDTPVAIVKGHRGPVNCVSWRRDGRYLVSGGNDSTIVLWRVER